MIDYSCIRLRAMDIFKQHPPIILLIIAIILIIALAYQLATPYINGSQKDLLSGIKAFGTLFIGMSVLLTAASMHFNSIWNKKDLTIKTLHEVNKTITQYRNELEDVLEITKRAEKQERARIEYIHNAMGVFLQNSRFVYHGQQTQDDIKNIQTSNEHLAKNFSKRINGREIDEDIRNLLNEFEYLALGCNSGIFNKKIILELSGPKFFLYFNYFANYIYHLRYDKRHQYGPALYEHFEKLAKEALQYFICYKKMYKDFELEEPNKDEYIIQVQMPPLNWRPTHWH